MSLSVKWYNNNASIIGKLEVLNKLVIVTCGRSGSVCIALIMIIMVLMMKNDKLYFIGLMRQREVNK